MKLNINLQELNKKTENTKWEQFQFKNPIARKTRDTLFETCSAVCNSRHGHCFLDNAEHRQSVNWSGSIWLTAGIFCIENVQ